MSRWRLCIATLPALGLLVACSDHTAPGPAQTSSPNLASVIAHAQQVPREQTWDGVVEAVHKVTLAAQTNARVQELPREVNDVVAKGDVLVRFSNVEQKSARSAAQAQIASAQASYTDALASYNRYAKVHASGFVSTDQLDQQRARRDAALAALQAARAQFKQVDQGVDYTVLRAPYAGIITQRFVEVGQAVQAGPPSPQPLIAMQSLEDLRVNVQVPQSAVAAIRQFHSADIVLATAGAPRITASSVSIFPYADPDTHSFNVRLQLPAGQSDLYPGMTVKVAFATGKAKRLMVPTSALLQRAEVIGVYVIDRHGVVLRQVRTGHHQGDQVEILAGLDDGERIATDPVAAMKYVVEHRVADAPHHG